MRILLITICMFWATLASALEVVDQKGRTIQFENPVERVVSIPIPAPSMFMSIDGSADKLVGVHQLTKTAMKGRFLVDFSQKFFNYPAILLVVASTLCPM